MGKDMKQLLGLPGAPCVRVCVLRIRMLLCCSCGRRESSAAFTGSISTTSSIPLILPISLQVKHRAPKSVETNMNTGANV